MHKAKIPSLTTSVQQSTVSTSQRNQTRKINRRHSNWEEKSSNISVCRWHNPKCRKPWVCPPTHTHTLVELADEFSKVARYKISKEKSVILIYIKNNLVDKEIKKAIPAELVQVQWYLQLIDYNKLQISLFLHSHSFTWFAFQKRKKKKIHLW